MQGMMKPWKLQGDHRADQIFIEVLHLPLFLSQKIKPGKYKQV